MNPLKLNYEDILSVACRSSIPCHDDEQWTATSTEWGFYQERYVQHNHLGVREIVTDFEKDCLLTVQDSSLPDSVHICIPLFGSIASNYHTCHLYTELRPRMHHHFYVPATEYEWRMSRNVRLVDVRIERDYFMNLLSDAEPWSAALREKLERRETTQSRQGLLCAAMQQIIHDILCTPLTGYLKKIFVEAKVLELIALQLHQSKNEVEEAGCPLRKKDREILEAIHEYLAASFTEDHSLKQLSKTYGLNEFILKKGFKCLYGRTIFEYLFELKMNHARHLLLEEGKMVCEVSREVGYKNPNHFSTAFKKKFGMNPVLLRHPGH